MDFKLGKNQKKFINKDRRVKTQRQEPKKQMSWKKLLHPEIQKHYSLIVKDGLSEVKNTNDVSNFEDVKSIEWQKSLLDKIPDNTFQDSKVLFQNKIDTLEHQNNNLKEELFYLREAILQVQQKNI